MNRNKNNYNKGKRKGGKPQPKFDSNKKSSVGSKDYSEEKPVEGGNDISWHKHFPELSEQATAIPWSWAIGKPVNLPNPAVVGGEPIDGHPIVVNDKYNIAGVCSVRVVLTPGTGDEPTDAVNIAAQAMYTDIRRMLKSANQYDQSDVMIYILGVGEVMAYISWCTRLFTTTMLYSHQNVYLPDRLLKMQGVDPEDFHNHYLEFLSRINQLIAKASQIYIPKGFDYLERLRWIFANYYSEGDSIKDQIYMFTPQMFRKFTMYDETDYAGALVPEVWIPSSTDPNLLKWTDICDHLNNMIDALVGDSDFQNIAGDLMNRYGETGVMTFSLIPQDSVVSIIGGTAAYEVLEQIQNSRVLPFAQFMLNDKENDVWIVKQNEKRNLIEAGARFVKTYTDAQDSWVDETAFNLAELPLTVHENPNPDKTMLITRDHNTVTDITVDKANHTITFKIEAACEILTGYEIMTILKDGSERNEHFSNMTSIFAADGLATISPFHYFPTVKIYDPQNRDVVGVHWNADITAPVTPEQLKDMNRVDLMSLFAVPDVGKVTK